MRKARGGWFSTLEHELTHAFFALLSFHKVHSIKTQEEGGYIQYSRWELANLDLPLLFPDLQLPPRNCPFLCQPFQSSFTNALLGLSLSYHASSTVHELHGGQTDLLSVGFPFAWLFLPGANVLCYTIIIGFAHGGVGRTQEYISYVIKNTFTLADKFIG